MDDLISRHAAIDVIMADKIEGDSLSIITALGHGNQAETLNEACDRHVQLLNDLPPAQPEVVISKQEYAEFFLGWLEEYRKQSTKLQGKYLPFEVLGWVVTDFRKLFPGRPVEP